MLRLCAKIDSEADARFGPTPHAGFSVCTYYALPSPPPSPPGSISISRSRVTRLRGAGKALGPSLCGAWVAQAAWAGLFSSGQLWASAATLGFITYEVHTAHAAVAPFVAGGSAFATQSVLGTLPFALHGAWLISSTLANVNVTVTAAGAGPSTLIGLAIATRVAAAVAAVALTLQHDDVTFALVGAWTLKAVADYRLPDSHTLAKSVSPRALTLLRRTALGLSASTAAFAAARKLGLRL